MPSTSVELQSLELLPGELLRPLGAFEELFCLFDQNFPTNGALAAQITGHTNVQQWREALDAVQQRHPLLSACIDTSFNRVPHFRRVTSQRIPLRVVTSAYARWQRAIAEEVNEPFTPDQAPLFRAVLLHQETHCTFILSSHHAVCDGPSRIFLRPCCDLSVTDRFLSPMPPSPIPPKDFTTASWCAARCCDGLTLLLARRSLMKQRRREGPIRALTASGRPASIGTMSFLALPLGVHFACNSGSGLVM
jgi:Condensation domain